MVLQTYFVTVSDPTDPTVYFERQIAKRPDLQAKFEEMIARQAEFHCSVCATHVIAETKHCAVCNRCCFEFDHHCRWVSNDIGRLNYIPFIRMLVWVCSTLLLSLALTIVAFASKNAQHVGSFMSHRSLVVLNIVTIVLDLAGLAFVVYLMSFHAWLMSKNMTTFKLIRE